MAYLGNGIYDLLDVVRASNNPQINYEGLYQDASAPMATSSLLQSMKPGYEFRNDSYMRNAYMNEGDDLSGNISTDYNRRLDFKNYFNNQPLIPTDGVNRFIGFNPRVGIVNAGLPFASTTSEDEEEDQLPYSGVEDMRYQTPRTIADQNRILGQTFTEQKPSGIARLFEVLGNIPTPFNLARRGLESLQGLNRKIRGTTFALSPTLKDYVQAKKAEKRAAAGADVGVSGGGRGSRRGDADISGPRGGFATDDTAGFF